MELSEAIVQNLFGFISGLIGAIVGGLFTLWAAYKTIAEENAKDDRQEEKEVQNMLDAIHAEISTLWGFHIARVGGIVENMLDGQALDFYYPLTQDYFTVYNTNASKIGLVKDPELRKSIVVTYNKCKKVVDGFKYNNELYIDWRDYADRSEKDIDHVRLAAKRRAMVEYAFFIRADHVEVKGYVENMLRKLEEYEAKLTP